MPSGFVTVDELTLSISEEDFSLGSSIDSSCKAISEAVQSFDTS